MSTHTHPHVHDDNTLTLRTIRPARPHAHRHRHCRLRPRHPHAPDMHQTHRHGIWRTGLRSLRPNFELQLPGNPTRRYIASMAFICSISVS